MVHSPTKANSRIHHAAGGAGIEFEKLADFAGFLAGHFFENFVESVLGKIGEEVGGGVGSHFFENVGGFAGIEFFDDLGGEALVKFGEDGAGGFFVERSDDALAFGGGKIFHDGGEIGGVQIFEFFVGDAQLHAAERIGLDEIHKFPADGTLREVDLQAANHAGRDEALKQAANGAGKADVDLREAQLGVAVGAQLDEVDIVDAHDFAAAGVDNLLIEQVFLDREPGFVGFVKFEGALADVEADVADGDGGYLVVARYERGEVAACKKEMGDAIGLVGGLDEKFANAADVIALRVVGFGAH